MPNDDIIVLLTVGLGTEDAALAYKIYRNALAKGLGTKVTYWNKPMF
jgi:ornithine cyclodeaminase/alanine dehydrogenase-like protein (mu-crystallin family)